LDKAADKIYSELKHSRSVSHFY